MRIRKWEVDVEVEVAVAKCITDFLLLDLDQSFGMKPTAVAGIPKKVEELL